MTASPHPSNPTTPELTQHLIDHLGPTLVAVLAGVRDRTLPPQWTHTDGPTPDPETETRLRAAHDTWTLLNNAEGDDTARAWFIGMNPILNDQAPVLALRDGNTAAVLAAAQAFTAGTDGW